jgi:hypothetical protein
MSEALQHHYLPIAYLEGFTNQSGMLFCADAERCKFYSKKPGNLAKRRDYNTSTLANGTKDRKTVEEFYGRFETTYKSDLARVLNGDQSFEIERRFLVFLALLKIRSPLSRDLLYSLLDRFSDETFVEQFSESERKLLLAARQGDRMARQEVSLSLSGHLYQPVAKQLERMHYRVLRVDEPSAFPTTDNCVQIIGLKKAQKKWTITLPTENVEVALLFPLSQSALLVGDSRTMTADSLFRMEAVHLQNYRTIKKYFRIAAQQSGYYQMFGSSEKLVGFPSAAYKNLLPNSRYEQAVRRILGALH